MPVAPNTRLGPYEIVALLGAGGMGEVYRAKDSRLERDVAIKVLPASLARDLERVARFQREAKLLASLNHPNIAAIHGFEEVEGKRMLVMELVEGATLAAQLHDRALPIEEALHIARQIAEALEAAHERGIIHRDLKPANVKITHDGTAKVLDFGLAKAMSEESSATDTANSPTITALHTRPGVVLGTAAYMSPEQARGKPVDKRTDIWSFGCVLYECLAGRRPFQGETTSDIMAQILEREPDWTELPDATPPSVRQLLHRSLVKDRRKRLRDAGDAALELEEILLGGTRGYSPSQASSIPRSSRKSAFQILGVMFSFALGLVLATMLWRQAPSTDPSLSGRVARYTVTLPPGTTIGTGRHAPLGVEHPSLALTPDGTLLVYIGVTDGVSRLFLRRADSLAATPMPETEGACDPFFSPNGQWVAFFADGKLKKVSPLGGVPVSICEAPIPKGGSWGPNDRIAFSRQDGSEICTVSSGGGNPKLLLQRSKTGSVEWPQFLPDGKWLLFAEGGVGARLLSLESGEAQTLLPGAEFARYVPSNHLLYLQQSGNVAVVPFQSPTRTLGESHIPLDADIRTANSVPQLAYSHTGTLAYVSGGKVSGNTLIMVDPAGKAVPLGCPKKKFGTFEFSPDGKRLAVEVQELGSDIWVYDLVRGAFSRLTTDGTSSRPLWAPDGNTLMFSSVENGERGIFAKGIDGGSERRLVLNMEGGLSSISPDGRYAILGVSNPATKGDLLIIPLAEPDKPIVFLNETFNEWGAAFAPNGKFIAYVSDASGHYEIFVAFFPRLDEKIQVSNGGGEEPIWSPAGDQLYYRNGDKWMAVPVQSDQEMSFGVPHLVFEGPYFNVWGRSYAVAPDTGRFLVIGGQKEEELTQITIVVNWLEEIKAKMPPSGR